MSTSKTRINISIPEDVNSALVKLAKRDQMPTATKDVYKRQGLYQLKKPVQ